MEPIIIIPKSELEYYEKALKDALFEIKLLKKLIAVLVAEHKRIVDQSHE